MVSEVPLVFCFEGTIFTFIELWRAVHVFLVGSKGVIICQVLYYADLFAKSAFKPLSVFRVFVASVVVVISRVFFFESLVAKVATKRIHNGRFQTLFRESVKF